MPAELRQFIVERGRPIDLLADIAAGRKVTAANPEDPGQKTRVYPGLSDRVAASRFLLAKLLPDLKATELSGPDGGPIPTSESSVLKGTPTIEVARRIAFILSSADHVLASQDHDTQSTADVGLERTTIGIKTEG